MAKPLNIAVVDAAGAGGEAILALPVERAFPIWRLAPLARARSFGRMLRAFARSPC